MHEAAVPDPLRCDVARRGSRAWVRPAGELDINTVHMVEAELETLQAGGCDDLVLDLGALTFMDSTGLRLAIRWDTAARLGGFRFAIAPGPEVVHRVFRLTGMDDHLTLVEPAP